MRGAKVFIGISGWTYPPWRGTFYPKTLPQRSELDYASRALTSLEINGTFYSLQKPSTFESWYAQTPAGFVFSIKAPQYLTHVLRLKEIEEPLANFFASGLLCLREKLGAILWQFPPNVMLKDDRFDKFLQRLPHTQQELARLARRHGSKVEGRSATRVETSVTLPVRHAFEFRHKSFSNPDFLALLRHHDAAFVLAHASERCPQMESITASFVYARLHGEGKPFKKGYPARALREWADRVRQWIRKKKTVFLYFSNEAKIHSPTGAIKLLKLLEE